MSAAAVQIWGCDEEQIADSFGDYFLKSSDAYAVGESREETGPETTTLALAFHLLTWKSEPGAQSRCTTNLNTFRVFLERRLKSVPEVDHVNIAEREKHGHRVLHVWTMLRRDDRDTRFRVYEVEQEILKHFPETLFEFHSHKVRSDAPEGDTTVYES